METREYVFQQIRQMNKEISNLLMDYWSTFVVVNWKFGLVVLMIIIPLILLYIYIDREYTILLVFFGLNYHTWFAYINGLGINLGLWAFPYPFIPLIAGLAIDASLLPVLYIFLYQWSKRNNKNMHLYAIVLSAAIAFILKPIMVNVNLFDLYDKVSYLHLFLIYYFVFVFSKLVSDSFVWITKKK